MFKSMLRERYAAVFLVLALRDPTLLKRPTNAENRATYPTGILPFDGQRCGYFYFHVRWEEFCELVTEAVGDAVDKGGPTHHDDVAQ